MKETVFYLSLLLMVFADSANSYGNQKIQEKLLSATGTDEMLRYAKELSLSGKNGIPTFLIVLSKSLDNTFLLTNYAKVNICIKSLHSLAKKGIFTKEEVPILIKALKRQAHIADTYRTAETLRIITGIDVGYTEKFIKSYTLSEENIRLSKIKKWEQWWEKKKAINE